MHHRLHTVPRTLLLHQKSVLLLLTLPNVHTNYQRDGAHQTEWHEEIERCRCAIIAAGGGTIDDGTRNERA